MCMLCALFFRCVDGGGCKCALRYEALCMATPSSCKWSGLFAKLRLAVIGWSGLGKIMGFNTNWFAAMSWQLPCECKVGVVGRYCQLVYQASQHMAACHVNMESQV